MKRLKVLTVLFCLGLFSMLNAYVEVEIDGRNTPEITFSSQAFNRVSYKEGGIKSVVGSKKDLDVNLSSGIAFIKPREGVRGPLTVTVITNDDEAQDLLIKVSEKAGEHVRLVDPKEDMDQLLEKIATIGFLNTLIEGDCPQNYKLDPSAEYTSLNLEEPLEVNYLRTYLGNGDKIAVYRIVNTSRKKEFVLNTSLFKNQSNLWVFLSKTELGPREEALCFMSIPRQGVFE